MYMLALIIPSYYSNERQVESEQFRTVLGPWPVHSRTVNQFSLGHRSCICTATNDFDKVLDFSILDHCFYEDDS